MSTRKRLLIIKHGFSETCDHNISPVVSYGDVFRCTCLLEDFKGWDVTWISAPAAFDLLTENHLIDHLILADSPDQIPAGLVTGHYQMIINLEKQKDWCEFAAAMPADIRYGFKDCSSPGCQSFYPESAGPLSAALERNGYLPLQETLFQTVGREWNGQRYILGYKPRVVELYDIGLNNHVGSKWPTKLWPTHHWKSLYRLLSDRYAVSWQQSLNSVRHYIDWLASCRLIITSDSLGLHVSLALRKKIVALFGATAPEQVYMYGHGIKLTPACDASCMPSFQSSCHQQKNCMEYLTPEMVVEAVDALMQGKAIPADEIKVKPAARQLVESAR